MARVPIGYVWSMSMYLLKKDEEKQQKILALSSSYFLKKSWKKKTILVEPASSRGAPHTTYNTLNTQE